MQTKLAAVIEGGLTCPLDELEHIPDSILADDSHIWGQDEGPGSFSEY